MPRTEFIELVKEIKKKGTSQKMTKRQFIWLFDCYEKRTSGNVWRINEYLHKEKLIVTPSYQSGWIDHEIELKGKDKAKITNGDSESDFDPINRLSMLEAVSKKPVSIKRDALLEQAYHLLWKNEFSQLPVMNDERNILGIISWETIAKGLITKKKSNCVKDYMSKDFIVLAENTPLFDAIKHVIKSGVVYVLDKENKVKGPITRSDLNIQFIEQIEPFILLEQIENFIRLMLHDKIILEDISKLLSSDDKEKQIDSISDMTFGEYLYVFSNNEMWDTLSLPFDKADFINELHKIREIRNDVMHFSPDRITKTDLKLLRKTSNFLMDFMSNY